MNNEKIGLLIANRRKELGLTQKQLAEALHVSDKAVSKWETAKGAPDVSLFPVLSHTLGLDLSVLLSGDLTQQDPLGGNMKKLTYYVCPVCGNLLFATGNAQIACCGQILEPMKAVKADEAHTLAAEQVEDEWFLTAEHDMTKDHYITFVALATADRLTLVKQYPEWNLQVRLPRRGHGMLLWHCNQHGLFYRLL